MNPQVVAQVVDGHGLEPPEPFVLTMDALDACPSGQAVLLLLPREPHPLYRALQAQGFAYQTERTAQGSYQIRIWHKSA